jgi:hypothetical protein
MITPEPPALETDVPAHVLDMIDFRDYDLGPLAAERDHELTMIELMKGDN